MKLCKKLWNKTIKLVLIQWYNFKLQNISYKYRCPYIKLVEIYNVIKINTIQNIVYIILYFDKNNEYFVNYI